MDDLNPLRVQAVYLINDFPSSIGRTVVHNDNRVHPLLFQNLGCERSDVSGLIIGWKDDDGSHY